MKKKVWLLVFAFLSSLIFYYLPSIIYGTQQLYGQLRIISGAVNIEEFLSREDIPDSLRRKLKLVSEIRKFAFEELGQTRSENYTSYYDQGGKPSLWVLSACPEFSLEPYVWKFPIAGKFPYKGFFDLKQGRKEEKTLKDMLYDTNLSVVEGWSTLGFFKDPILSNMLKRAEGRLANLIIHELTHGTIFLKDSVEYNENLANFIGIKGSILFLKLKYGSDHDMVYNYILELERRKVFSDFLIKMAPILDSTYNSFESGLSILKKREIKKMALKEIKQKWYNIRERVFMDTIPDTLWFPDNTLFAGFIRYNSQYEVFEKELELKYEGSLRRMVQSLKN